MRYVNALKRQQTQKNYYREVFFVCFLILTHRPYIKKIFNPNFRIT